MSRGVDVFHPFVAFPLLYVIYFSVGSLKLTNFEHVIGSYRSEVSTAIVVPVVLGLLSYLVGVMTTLLRPRHAWSWRLSDATKKQREKFEIIGNGIGVHWPDIDEDISTEGMLNGIPAKQPKKVQNKSA